MTIRIAECYIYPLKSAQGINVDTLDITNKGPAHDRSWMLIQDQGDQAGRFISQRDQGCEKLALIRAIPKDNEATDFILPSGLGISIRNSDLTPHNAPVTVWKDACDALDAGDKAAEFFSNYLGLPCRLVKMSDSFIRQADLKFSQQGDMVSFADGFPLLITNHASLEKLSEHFPENTNVSMQNFRPNIVLKGIPAFEEDVIYQIQIGDVILELAKPCTRCKITTIDQSSGISASKEPLQTLAKTRRGKGDGLQGVFFGQNALPRALGTIKVGDEVKILSKKELHPALQNALLKPESA